MASEIERKFLVKGEGWRDLVTSRRTIRQGYLARGTATVRVRLIDDSKAVLTIKSADGGISRSEFEYEVPLDDATEMLHMCGDALIEKSRHHVPAGPLTWEIDEFSGRNSGLVLAEIELDHETQDFDKPGWLGEDVTNDTRYFNAQLSARPFSDW